MTKIVKGDKVLIQEADGHLKDRIVGTVINIKKNVVDVEYDHYGLKITGQFEYGTTVRNRLDKPTTI